MSVALASVRCTSTVEVVKTLLTLPMVAVLLCGCTDTRPIAVSVPGDLHILHGTFIGTAGTAMIGEPSQTFPVVLTSTATYVSQTVYKINGTLTLRDVTYTFQGEGTGQDGATFRPQYTQVPEPSLLWEAILFLNGERVGQLDGISYPRRTAQQWGGLRIGGASYLLTLDRR